MKNPITTVFCAVWSGDESRHELLFQHYENVSIQTSDVEVVYVFDNNDSPPRNLPGRKLICNYPLTIYEAWNVALAACHTPYVMNLNLDDRLYVDSVEMLEEAIQAEEGALVGGDWKICYSQDEANLVENCYAAESIPFLPQWPPVKGSITRLGSGTGSRGTYGPATLWRLDCHVGAPRYPYRTEKGTKIRSIADSIWWNIIQNHLKLKMLRLPMIIGNYYSHPETQAEFRNQNEHELLRNQLVSKI